MACCNPCSAQIARKWRLIHGSPKSQHNEVFLRKENKKIKSVPNAYAFGSHSYLLLVFSLFFQLLLPYRLPYT